MPQRILRGEGSDRSGALRRLRRQRRIFSMRIRLPRASNLLQKAVALLLLLGILVEVAGIPVVRVSKKDRSRPYPCQDRPCGCASADECWHHCCCMNNKEKLAWARAHGVTPPDFIVAAAEQERDEPAQICDREEGGKN